MNSNVTESCPLASSCGNGSEFYQIFYRVELEYTFGLGETRTSFYLDYEEIETYLYLDVPSRLYGGQSAINRTVTLACWADQKGLNNWSSKATLIVDPITENYVSVAFEDSYVNSCPSDQIYFSYTSGNTVTSTLFFVAVDAFPGEQIQLKCSNSDISKVEFESQLPCSPLECATDPDPVTVGFPADPSSGFGPNENLKLEFRDLTVTTPRIVGVFLTNSHYESLDIFYLDYLVKIQSDKIMNPITVLNHYGSGPNYKQVGGDDYYKFVANPASAFSVAANSEVEIARFSFAGPVLENQDWTTTFSFPSPEASRIKSEWDCSGLDAGSALSIGNQGDDPCTIFQNYKFFVRGLPADNCDELFLELGLQEIVDDQMDNTLNLEDFEIELRFDLPSNIKIDGVQLGDLSLMGSCTTSNCVYVGINQSLGLINLYFDGNSQDYAGLLVGDNDQEGTMKIKFKVDDPKSGCIDDFEVTKLQVKYLQSPSVPACIPAFDQAAKEGFPICLLEQQKGRLATELNQGVLNAEIKVAPSCSTSSVCQERKSISNNSGDYAECFSCSDCKEFTFTPTKNDNPLNGVTTFDLVLINRHILGLQVLDSPYKIIAADANKNGSITSFDVVELRKLILGIYNELPANTSWRFVDKAYQFPNPQFPFQPQFPESIEVSDISQPNTSLDFIAIKVGDVNNSAIPNDKGAKRPLAPFALSGAALKNGNTVTIPVMYAGEAPLEAVQLGLRFDPQQLKLVSPSLGDVPGYTADYFGLTRLEHGEIRTLWLADPTDEWNLIAPGTVLFNLTFEVLDAAKGTSTAGLLVFDNSVLPNAAWSTGDEEYEVVETDGAEMRQSLAGEKINSAFHAVCVPNPTGSVASLQLYSWQAGKGFVALFGPYGNRIAMQAVNWQAGEQRIAVPGLAQQPAGVYRWAIFGGGNSTQGLVIKH